MGQHFDRDRTAALIDALAPARLTRIVDIGASAFAHPAYGDLLEMGGCELWGFEPLQEQYDKLVARRAKNEHYIRAALGSGEVETLYLTKGAGFTSVLEPRMATAEALGTFHLSMQTKEVVEVRTMRLDDVPDLPAPDMVKIDIQGGEAQAFAHGARVLSQALAVITEVAAIPLYVDQPLLDDQMRILRGHGLNLHKFLTFRAERLTGAGTNALMRRHHGNQLIDGDAVFLRGVLDREALSDDQLTHLAIIADAVIESFDLAVLLLSLLVARGRLAQTALDAYISRLPGRVPDNPEALLAKLEQMKNAGKAR